MNIGILCTISNTFGRKGYYNGQEIGLGKALVKRGHRVIIYKAALKDTREEKIVLEKGLAIRYIHMPHLGVHGYLDCRRYLHKDLDAILCFADHQIFLPHVIRYCRRNHIVFVPYIGTARSQDDHSVHGFVMNRLFSVGTLRYYRKMPVLAKTDPVKEDLRGMRVRRVETAPVGIDLTLLNSDFRSADRDAIRREFGYTPSERIICCVGKLVEVKQPLRLIEIMRQLVSNDRKNNSGCSSLRMVIVGEGNLRAEVDEKIQEYDLAEYIKVIDRVPYEEMWKIYTMSDYFFNVSRREVFGMAVMEAIYYETAVAAAPASGPVMILQGMPGHRICESDKEFISFVQNTKLSSEDLRKASDRIAERFSWEHCADAFERIVTGDCRVIINSDDFGQKASCTQAIWEAMQRGLVTDTTMVANGESFDTACALLAGESAIPDIKDRIGIHFVLTADRPLTEEIKACRRLTKNGVFRKYLKKNGAYFIPLTRKEKEAIYIELTAQAERLKTAGINISHADSHHHIHMNFQVAPVFARVCREQGIKKVRIHQNVRYKTPLRRWMFERYNRWLKKQGFYTTDYFENSKGYSELLPGICEVMVHADFDEEHRLIDRVRKREGKTVEEDLKLVLEQISVTEKNRFSYHQL